MSYKDKRSLESKMAEHRAWNTLELEIDSAASAIAAQLLSAISELSGKLISAESFVAALDEAHKGQNEQLAEGLVRLGVLCSNETPNRFKALFPAFLLQREFASPEGDRMRWAGSKRVTTRTVTVDALTKIFATGVGGEEPRRHFAEWIQSKGGFNSIGEICQPMLLPENFIYSLSLRLAQGADTNRRGHTATDTIKERLAEYGYSPVLGNTNTSDVAAASLVKSYEGPRKFDTVVWDAARDVALVCQSQMYSSDVGSIQGKTVEEDYDAISNLKEKWGNLVSLTNTEGFGCHTTMLSRLKHVLNSKIDGFIQLKTLDTKLRFILREIGCVSLLDFEIFLLSKVERRASVDSILSAESLLENFEKDELEAGLKLYTGSGLLGSDGESVSIKEGRFALACYYKFVDKMLSSASPIINLSGEIIRIGGLPIESGVTATEFEAQRTALEEECSLAGLNLEIFRQRVSSAPFFVKQIAQSREPELLL